MTHKKFLVTGGAGFIGSNFIHYLLQKYTDIQVINLDKLTYSGNLDNLKEIAHDPRYTFIHGDICDQNLVEEIFATQIDIVVNFAAESHVDRSIMNPDAFIKTNIYGTFILLEASKKHGIKTFIQISTDEIYGSIEKGSFTETGPLMPSSPYSASKVAADRLSYAYYTTYHLPVIITRSCNCLGQYQYPEKLIPLFITNALENKPLPIYGDGKNVRDWLHVLDYCEAIDFLINHGITGEVYNISGSNEKNNLEITEAILNHLQKPQTLIRHVPDRLGHDRRYAIDCSKLHSLGWKQRYTFEAALYDVIEWYTHNESWWKKIKSGEYLEYYKKQYKTLT